MADSLEQEQLVMIHVLIIAVIDGVPRPGPIHE